MLAIGNAYTCNFGSVWDIPSRIYHRIIILGYASADLGQFVSIQGAEQFSMDLFYFFFRSIYDTHICSYIVYMLFPSLSNALGGFSSSDW